MGAVKTQTTIRLAELTQEWARFYRAVEENEGVVTPELEAQHACLQLDTGEKVDGYMFRLHAFDGEVAALKALEAQVRERRIRLEKEADRLEQRVWDHMDALKLTELQGEVLTGFKVQGAGGQRGLEMVVASPDAWSTAFWKEPQVDEAKVKAHLLTIPAGELQVPEELVTDSLPKGTVLARLKPRGRVLRRYV